MAVKRANEDIRMKAKQAHVHLYQIAECFEVSEFTFIRWMRHEFDEEKKKKAFEFIDQIANERSGA